MEDKRHLQNQVQRKGYGYSMGKKQGYIITTKCLRLRCRHPEWLSETQDFYNQIQKFYYDLFLEHSELREENSQVCLREMERLSIRGRDGKEVPSPLPWEKVPLYFRRAAANAGIAAAKSHLSRQENGYAGKAESFHSAVTYYKGMYRDFESGEITLRVWNGSEWRWMRCRLYGKAFPEGAQLMSPSVVLDQKYEMLHVPVKEIVQDASIAKERIVEGRNVCGIHFTNGDAFAVASVMNCEGKELAVRYFKGGKEYTHRCSKVLEKIEKSRKSRGENAGGRVNQKYWMHLKNLGEQYAHQISLNIVTFCKEQDVSVIAFPKYDEEYRRHVLKGAGNFGTLHLSTRIREYLTYKAWKEGILVLDVNAKEMHRICAVCGSEIARQDKQSKRFVCEKGHQGDAYLNVARNAAKRCLEQFQKKVGKEKNVSAKKS